MDYKKPQDTLMRGGIGIYPLTTADQVILSDGSRLEKNGQISIGSGTVKTVSGVAPDSAGNVALGAADIGAATAGEVSQLKSDKLDKTGTAADSSKLGGKSASEYALKTDTAPDSSKLGGKTLAEIMLALYPVGSIYISVSATSPASLFGGTWEQLKDRFLVGAGNSYSVNGTGGASSVNITPSGNNSGTALNIDQMPSHSHGFILNIQHSDGATTSGEAMKTGLQVGGRARYNGTTYSTGNGQAHTHTFVGTTQTVSTMPPYLAVYMWKRVS